MTYREIPGWSEDIFEFYRHMASVLPRGGRFVEVGVFLGRSLAYMGTIRPDLELWAVDPWDDSLTAPYWGEHGATLKAAGGLFPAFLYQMGRYAPEVLARTHVVRARSTDVTLPRADLVFIDGAHDYENVRADIFHWRSQVKKGGVLAGHDFDSTNPGVMRAVCELLGGPFIHPTPRWSTCWRHDVR